MVLETEKFHSLPRRLGRHKSTYGALIYHSQRATQENDITFGADQREAPPLRPLVHGNQLTGTSSREPAHGSQP
jgi:hypothetical protein